MNEYLVTVRAISEIALKIRADGPEEAKSLAKYHVDDVIIPFDVIQDTLHISKDVTDIKQVTLTNVE